ncbi:unnamed protein product [Toxocara canis]|uniref:UPF0729 protein GD16342 n=1 Tax=Toxocara canis TaxID=6265 RepID=A0A183ULL8_TOXCA|nr:unnamed protein product [Toxocara canis]
MVCVPCIILPILLAIYLKFIQPYVLHLLPESWRIKFDAILYPTCPARPPPPVQKESVDVGGTVQSDDTAAKIGCDKGVRQKVE